MRGLQAPGRSALLLALTVAITGMEGSCTGVREQLVEWFAPEYAPQGDPARLEPAYTGADAERRRIAVRLAPVAEDLSRPTDVQFVPGRPRVMAVLQQSGKAVWVDLERGRRGVLLTVPVVDEVEQGLLGLAFHPDFARNGRFFLNYTAAGDGGTVSRVAEWRVPPGGDLRAGGAREVHTVVEVAQPYPNHNAGQLAFGPEGHLYIGWGDGGWRGDPEGHGQDPSTLLGTMMRVSVDGLDPDEPYRVPADNPFVGRQGYRPEVWAYGLRNPWRYTFDGRGRLIVADVGQNAWEEIDIVTAGGNYGWNVREGRHCYQPEADCPNESLTDPVYEYGRAEGGSVTGGYVARGDAAPALRGRYVFGDFLSGRLWALELPEEATAPPGAVEPWTLGKWPLLLSTFGRDANGDIYVADYHEGAVYRIETAR